MGYPHATYYVAALLQSVPSLFRGMIRSGMRGGTPLPSRPNVLTCASDEAAWKTYLDIRDTSLPGVLLLDDSGRARWSYNSLFDPNHYRALKTATAVALEPH